MNKYRKLLLNSGIFTIANFGTKLLNIVFVPLYTYWLTTGEYGTVDLVTTTVNLLAPIVMLGMSDAVMRFAFEKTVERNNLISSGVYVFCIGSLIIGFLGLLLAFVFRQANYTFKPYVFIFLLMLYAQSANSILAQYHRGIGNVMVFALNGILITIVQITMNIITLALLHMGVMGYLLSMLVSYILPTFYLLFRDNVWRLIRFRYRDDPLIRKMLAYTLPLIPTNMMWWVMNLSSRYVIVGTLGVAANGIFAVSNKIPTIINLLNTIFQQAWQMSAIEEFISDKESDEHFISSVYQYFVLFMILGTTLLMIASYPIVKYTFSIGYFSSIRYIPYMLLAAMFSNFAGFLGTNYVASKSTIGALKTSFIGAVVNFVLTIIFIRKWGLSGVAWAMIIAYVLTWIYRIFDTRNIVPMRRLDLKLQISMLVVALLSVVVASVLTWWSVVIGVGTFIVLILINQYAIREIITVVVRGVKK